MNKQLKFDEPSIYLGETHLREGLHRFYLPLATVLSHSLVISRSGGGKSHLLAILAMGLAKASAVRRLNLLAALEEATVRTGIASKSDLVGMASNRPPLTVCLFDPHRDLVKRLLEDLSRQVAVTRVRRKLQQRNLQFAGNSSPSTATSNIPNWEDVLEEMITYIDLGDRQNVFGLNLLDTAIWESKENCASTLIEIFRRIYPDAWGSRMEDCFRHSIFALYLLNTQRTREEQFTILDIIALITLDHWRESLLDHPVISMQNPVIGAWWKVQFADKMSDNFRNEVIKPVLNKLNPFLGSDILSRIFGQSRTTLDFEPLIRQGSIVLIDLAASEIETENCALAGAILIGFLLKKVRQLADGVSQEGDRPAVQLMVDEFNVLLAAPYADIMGQYRKWGVGATLATQSLTLLDELDRTLRPLVMANAANLMVLQVNAEDAEYLRRELVADGTTSSRGSGLNGVSGSFSNLSAGGGRPGPDLYDLVNAERGMCYFKGTFNNIREQVFTVRIAPRPFQQWQDNSQAKDNGSTDIEHERELAVHRIVRRCWQKYTLPGEEVRVELNRKQQDYLQLYRLEPLKLNESSLLNGFTSWQVELMAGLEARLKRARIELEEERLHRTKNRRRRNSGGEREETTPMEDDIKASIEEAELNPATSFKTQNENKVVELHEGIPKFAPGYNSKPPQRRSVSRSQIFQENRQLPDGNDYTATGQVEKQRRKDRNQARKHRKALSEIETEQKRWQSQLTILPTSNTSIAGQSSEIQLSRAGDETSF